MDVIDNAIEKKWYITDDEMINRQSWEMFAQKSAGKKIFLYGVGDGLYHFMGYYANEYSIEGILDSNKRIHGLKLSEIIMHNIPESMEDLEICDPHILDNYAIDEIVVLVLSLKQFPAIIAQLKNRGLDSFSFLVMESKLKGEHKGIDYRRQYIEKCCEEKINEKKIVLYTMGSFSGHGKQIVLKLLKLRKDLDIVWIVNECKEELDGIRFVYKHNKKQFIYEMETAKYWIYDDMVPKYFVKRPEQIYIQIKHWSSITLKTFGFDLTRFRGEKSQIEVCEYNREWIDYMITGSKFDTETCRRGFEFEGKIFEAGSARTDVLFTGDKYYKKICEEYGRESGCKYLLYAPTFRCKKNVCYQPDQGEIELDFEKVKEALELKFGGEWYILLRLHPVVANKADKMDLPSYVINVSDYPDSQELVAASDVMITDYSSIMFEPAFVNKPVFLFATDREEYIDGERGLLIDYNELPFSISDSNEELVKRISEFNQEDYEHKLNMFFEQYGVHEDGHASERAAQFISDIIDGKEV
jgi:CDP-glycerol glycerophosphotransferase (TagB/SpsB family)